MTETQDLPRWCRVTVAVTVDDGRGNSATASQDVPVGAPKRDVGAIALDALDSAADALWGT